ncbi:MAG: glycosyltransferase family 2 protein [Candidatus Omnitrophota bacterium]
MKLTILISCFNEKATILKAIEEARAVKADKEIIVIDNCSTDGTREILLSVSTDKDLKIVFNSRNMGAGYSGRQGIQLARGDYFYAPGADLEYRMEDACRMMEKMESENLDVVFGSRLLAKKGVPILQLIKERPFWLGSIVGTSLINILYGKDFTDVIGTYLARASILKPLKCASTGQALMFELASKFCKQRYKIGEMPVCYEPRTHEQGKTIKALDMIPAIWAVFKVKLFA